MFGIMFRLPQPEIGPVIVGLLCATYFRPKFELKFTLIRSRQADSSSLGPLSSDTGLVRMTARGWLLSLARITRETSNCN